MLPDRHSTGWLFGYGAAFDGKITSVQVILCPLRLSILRLIYKSK